MEFTIGHGPRVVLDKSANAGGLFNGGAQRFFVKVEKAVAVPALAVDAARKVHAHSQNVAALHRQVAYKTLKDLNELVVRFLCIGQHERHMHFLRYQVLLKSSKPRFT